MNAFFVDLKKNIISPKFCISILLMVLLCLLADAPSVSAREPLSIFDEIIKMRKDVWLDKGIDFSAPAVFYRFDNSLWYDIVLPIIAAFPVVYHFHDEWFGESYIMTLSRCGYKKYAFSKLSAAFVSGFMTAIIGIAVFGVTIFCIFPSVNNFTDAGDWYYGGIYASSMHAIFAKGLNHALVCGMYALSSIFICLLLKDKFFTLSIFMVLNFFSMKLEIKFTNSVLFTNERYRVLRVLFPGSQTEIHSIFPSELHISFYWYIMSIIVVCVVMSIISYRIIKRRYKYAS